MVACATVKFGTKKNSLTLTLIYSSDRYFLWLRIHFRDWNLLRQENEQIACLMPKLLVLSVLFLSLSLCVCVCLSVVVAVVLILVRTEEDVLHADENL